MSVSVCAQCRKRPKEPDRNRCSQCLEHAREYQRQRRASARESGTCSVCEGPIGEGGTSTLCRKHAQHLRDRAALYRRMRLSRGICTYCGKRPRMPGRTRCKPCIVANHHRSRMYKGLIRSLICVDCGAHMPTRRWPGRCRSCSRERSYTRGKSRYWRLVSEEKCVRCEIPLSPNYEGRRCLSCAKKAADLNRMSEYRRYIKQQKERNHE